MKYIIFSYDGYVFPIAKRLVDEGQSVVVCQVENGAILEGKPLSEDDESPQSKRRRMSLYEGILKKHDLKKVLRAMKKIQNKDEYFVLFDFNNLYKIAEVVLKMGFTKGNFPLKEDYEKEKDRNASKELVKKYWPGLKLREAHEFTKVDDAIAFLEEKEGIWGVKSDGNAVSTFFPDGEDEEMAKKATIGQLKANQKDYETGSFILEEKIINAIEFAPQIAFWDGKPIATQLEFETRLMGGEDIGNQTGGNQNLVVKTDFEDRINVIAFPPIVHEVAAKRKGLYLADAGIISDGKDLYFTEFAGNRWGWGGVMSEMSMAREGEKIVSAYFEKVARGENPQNYKYGTTISIYNIPTMNGTESDEKNKAPKEGEPIDFKDESAKNIYVYQMKKDGDRTVNVGYYNSLLAYIMGFGDSIINAAKEAYRNVDNFSFRGKFYRPYSDFVSINYTSSIFNRLKYCIENDLIKDGGIMEEINKEHAQHAPQVIHMPVEKEKIVHVLDRKAIDELQEKLAKSEQENADLKKEQARLKKAIKKTVYAD